MSIGAAGGAAVFVRAEELAFGAGIARSTVCDDGEGGTDDAGVEGDDVNAGVKAADATAVERNGSEVVAAYFLVFCFLGGAIGALDGVIESKFPTE